MKKIIILLMMCFFSFAYAQEENQEIVEKDFSIGVLKGPSGIVFSYQMETLRELDGINISYEIFANANQVVPKLLNEEIDLTVLPVNLATKLYTSSNGEIAILGICGNGMLSIISSDPSISVLEDLKGKKLYVAGQGGSPDVLIHYLLDKKSILIGGGKNSVDIDFSIPNAQLIPSLISGKIKYALVPEPFTTVAMKTDGKIKKVIDIQDEFFYATNIENYPMSVIVVNKKFIKENRKFIKKYISAYKEASEWVGKNPVKAGVFFESYSLGLDAKNVSASVPNCNFVFIPAKESKKIIEDFISIFIDYDSKFVGTVLPDENFYFE